MWQPIYFLLLFLPLRTSEVVIGEKQVQAIFDMSPKLHIKGFGFDAREPDITIEMSAQGAEPLRKGIDFLLSKDRDGLVLTLVDQKKSVPVLSPPHLLPPGGSILIREFLRWG
jgi:hypothetical protein